MTSHTPESDTNAARAHAEYLLLYNNATRNIEFTKRQSWWLTYQALGAIGVLVFVERQFDPFTTVLFSSCIVTVRINTLGSLVIIALMLSVVYYSYKLIDDLNIWAEGERKRLEFFIREKFTDECREAWKQKEQHRHLVVGKKREKYRHEWIMNIQFVVIFVGCYIGGILVVLSG